MPAHCWRRGRRRPWPGASGHADVAGGRSAEKRHQAEERGEQDEEEEAQQQRRELAPVVADVLLRDLVAHEDHERLHRGAEAGGHAACGSCAIASWAITSTTQRRDARRTRGASKGTPNRSASSTWCISTSAGPCASWCSPRPPRAPARQPHARPPARRGRSARAPASCAGAARRRLGLGAPRRGAAARATRRDHWRTSARHRAADAGRTASSKTRKDHEVGEQRDGQRHLGTPRHEHARHHRREHHAHPPHHPAEHRAHEGVVERVPAHRTRP